ncbi:hypothetical protein TNO020_40028 [Tenacibaculum piscium]|uniref:Uncharacterized protein n=1 Tax=Tenacibaculum piscium TaxID=1458515 RepID=A0A2H1YH41_9FLAO|nr:hypothetical protein TNO020_40028 [Tenacibaculum piscium]
MKVYQTQLKKLLKLSINLNNYYAILPVDFSYLGGAKTKIVNEHTKL